MTLTPFLGLTGLYNKRKVGAETDAVRYHMPPHSYSQEPMAARPMRPTSESNIVIASNLQPTWSKTYISIGLHSSLQGLTSRGPWPSSCEGVPHSRCPAGTHLHVHSQLVVYGNKAGRSTDGLGRRCFHKRPGRDSLDDGRWRSERRTL